MMNIEKILARFGFVRARQEEVSLDIDTSGVPRTDVQRGLTSEQAAQRAEDGLANLPVESPGKSVKAIVLSNIFTYFNLIFIIIAIALLSVGSFNHMMFLPIMVANTLISMIQELRSKKTLDRLSLLAAQMITVIRDGGEKRIDVSSLVRDDIVLLSAGDQIPADAFVASGEINVNESLVTGESDEVHKGAGDTLLSGSFVVSGSCRAQLCAVGAQSFASRLTLAAKKSGTVSSKQSGMMRSLSRLIAVIGVILIPMAALLVWRHRYTLGLGWADSVEKTAAALLGMIPEGLFLLVSVALAVSVMKLARKRTLVRELRSIENLARVDVLCVDKTGTITENEMRLDRIIPIKSAAKKKDEDTPSDSFSAAVEPLSRDGDADFIASVLRDFALSHGDANQTLRAVTAFFADRDDVDGGEDGIDALFPPRDAEDVFPFSSAHKYSATEFEDGECWLFGAPDRLLRFGGHRSVLASAERYAAKGCRVLLLARYGGSVTELPFADSDLSKIKPVALVTFVNPVRADAAETFGYFTSQGVAIKVISGDSPVTASASASEAGIPGAEKYVDATTLVCEDAVAEAAEKYTVFGRVTPEQKKSLIRSLKAQGHTVAMTGDGVNDVLALKEADCSIAMASGSDIASRVSQLVLLDCRFASLPSVVAEGRRVINNIQRSAALFLVKNIFSFFLAWITILSSSAYPLSPAQLTIINALTIGAPSFLLSLEPNHELVKGKFLRNVLYRAAPAAFTNLTLIIGAMLFRYAFPTITDDETSTVSALLMGIVGFIMLWRVCCPFNKFRAAMYGVLMAAFVGGSVLFSSLFSLSPLSFGASLVLAVLGLLAYPTMSAYTALFEKLSALKKKLLDRLRQYRN